MEAEEHYCTVCEYVSQPPWKMSMTDPPLKVLSAILIVVVGVQTASWLDSPSLLIPNNYKLYVINCFDLLYI